MRSKFSVVLTQGEIGISTADSFGKCKHGLIQFRLADLQRERDRAQALASRSSAPTDSVGAVSAQFDTSNGTATAGSDYTAKNNFIVNFADGDAADQTVTIPITQRQRFTKAMKR